MFEFPFGVSFLIRIVTGTFVDVANVDGGSTEMLHCFTGAALVAAANASVTMAVSNVTIFRKLLI
jgi:hypothetical protein